ncbi:hypothetical protein ABZ896_14490 [Streptomyces sp. NPDC047072]|uniref:hypothetical protein n=1 Tax=Streptomyces sp. NPDC047072 TaxID=3154809 RepID=UPI0033EF14BA
MIVLFTGRRPSGPGGPFPDAAVPWLGGRLELLLAGLRQRLVVSSAALRAGARADLLLTENPDAFVTASVADKGVVAVTGGHREGEDHTESLAEAAERRGHLVLCLDPAADTWHRILVPALLAAGHRPIRAADAPTTIAVVVTGLAGRPTAGSVLPLLATVGEPPCSTTPYRALARSEQLRRVRRLRSRP